MRKCAKNASLFSINEKCAKNTSGLKPFRKLKNGLSLSYYLSYTPVPTIPHLISKQKVQEMKHMAFTRTACRDGTSTAYLKQFEDGTPPTM
jgi:hypothetical protein